MDEAIDHMRSADGNVNNNRQCFEESINTGTGSDSDDSSDFNVDSTMSSSEYDSYTSSRSYTSPRALILASKSSEEDLVVPQSIVKARHKWIEETLLKDDSAAQGTVLKNRHSLPANKILTPPSGSSEDVLARLLMTTESRKLSRELAKAKVQADISALSGDNELAETEKMSDQAFVEKEYRGGEYLEVSELRARAQLKLNSAMELLAVTSLRNTCVMNGQRNSPISSAGANNDSCKMQEDEVKFESPVQIAGNKTSDIKYDDTSKTNSDDGEEPMQRNEGISMGQSERDLLAVDEEAQGTFEHQNKDYVEDGIVSSTEQYHDDKELEELSLVQIKAEMAHENESATDLTTIDTHANQEDEMAKLEEEVRQSVQKRLEGDRTAADQAKRRIDDESINEHTQSSFSCDLGVSNSSKSSEISASLLEKPSDTSDASLPSQVDEILYQGKVNNALQAGGLRASDSAENEYDDIDIENGYYCSSSQSSDMDPSNVNTDMATPSSLHSSGPMWKLAAEQASMIAAETRLDALDPSITRQYDSNARQMSNQSRRKVDKTTKHGTETFTQWNGFNRDRMSFMVAIGVMAGILPSLYAQWTCHFVTGDVIDGDESTFILNFGLQEFTPIDSSFQGYQYCLDYDSKYNYNPPLLPRIAGIAAIIFGSIPLLVISVYLLYSMTHTILWKSSMWMLYFGSICQISTLSIFFLDPCQDGISCSMGPGAWATVISSLCWFALSIEMKSNSALTHPMTSEGVVVIERESTCTSWVKKNWNSAIGEPSLSRTAMKMQKRVRKGGSEPGRYRPPVVI